MEEEEEEEGIGRGRIGEEEGEGDEEKEVKLHCMWTVVKVLMKRNMGPSSQCTCWQGNHDQLFVIVNFP